MTLNAAQVLLGDHAAQRLALICGAERLTYAELRDRVARCASAWQQQGLVPGDRVAIKLPDGCASVCAFLGAIWAGGVAVLINPRLPRTEWQAMLEASDFRCVLAEVRDDTPPAFADRTVLLAGWQSAAAAAAAIPAVLMGEDEPAFWTCSSGTTGTPKSIQHAQRSALHVARASAQRLGIRAGDRLYASSKLFFCYPLANSLMAGLKLGATVILDPQWPTARLGAQDDRCADTDGLLQRAFAVPRPAQARPGAAARAARRAAVRVGRRSAAGNAARRLARNRRA